MTITSDSVVTLHYTVSTEDGTTLDSSEGKSPLVVLLGRRFLIEGLEDALIGKTKEDSFNVSVDPEMFTEGTELLLFYAVGTEGLKKSPGSVWIYSDCYVFSTGSIFLPGAPIEEVRLMP